MARRVADPLLRAAVGLRLQHLAQQYAAQHEDPQALRVLRGVTVALARAVREVDALPEERASS